jgi:1,4-alpha-glucan branching enzyme
MGPLSSRLFREGRHPRLADELGAHRVAGTEGGWRFAVWAPRAEQVRVIGDWNRWTGEGAALDPLGETGVWSAVVEGPRIEQLYKYRIEAGGATQERADPFALACEPVPGTASRLADPRHAWGDGAWMQERAARMDPEAPVAIYEVHLGSWRRRPDGGFLSYREVAPRLVEHVRSLGFTHVELMPLTEHPYYGSWGYQTTAYFAPTARYGRPEDLMALIDELHQAEIGVVLDWVPSHFATDEYALARFDGAPLFEHPDPRRGLHPDWGSSIFDYDRPEVRSFLLSSAHFWVDRYHVDALRVDGVASMLYLDFSRAPGMWLPNEDGTNINRGAVALLTTLTGTIHEHHPGVRVIAEESTAWRHVTGPEGLGFDWKWDLGWMHDTLRYLAEDPLHRKHHHEAITFRGMYAWNERFVLPLSHDEVVHQKRPLLLKLHGEPEERLATLKLLYAMQVAAPGKKLLFMGSELAPLREWSHEESLPWELLADPAHAAVRDLVVRLNYLYRTEPALHEIDHEPTGFRWSVVDEREESVFAWLRFAKRLKGTILAVFNCTPVPRPGFRIGVPSRGRWRTVLDTASTELGGRGSATPVSHRCKAVHGRELGYELVVDLPPLAAIYLRHQAS